MGKMVSKFYYPLQMFIEYLGEFDSANAARLIPIRARIDELLDQNRYKQNAEELQEVRVEIEEENIDVMQVLQNIDEQIDQVEKELEDFSGSKLEDKFYDIDAKISKLMIQIDNIQVKDPEVKNVRKKLMRKLNAHAETYDDKCAMAPPTITSEEREVMSRYLEETAAKLDQVDLSQFKLENAEELDGKLLRIFVEANSLECRKDDAMEEAKLKVIRSIQDKMSKLAQLFEECQKKEIEKKHKEVKDREQHKKKIEAEIQEHTVNINNEHIGMVQEGSGNEREDVKEPEIQDSMTNNLIVLEEKIETVIENQENEETGSTIHSVDQNEAAVGRNIPIKEAEAEEPFEIINMEDAPIQDDNQTENCNANVAAKIEKELQVNNSISNEKDKNVGDSNSAPEHENLYELSQKSDKDLACARISSNSDDKPIAHIADSCDSKCEESNDNDPINGVSQKKTVCPISKDPLEKKAWQPNADAPIFRPKSQQEAIQTSNTWTCANTEPSNLSPNMSQAKDLSEKEPSKLEDEIEELQTVTDQIHI